MGSNLFLKTELTPGDYVLFVLADGLVLKTHTHRHTCTHTEYSCCLGLLWLSGSMLALFSLPPAARSSALSTANPLSAGILMLTQHQAASRGPLSFWTVSGLTSDSGAFSTAVKNS